VLTDLLLAAFLSAWLVLTIVWNVPPLDRAVSPKLPAGRWLQLVPLWSFFAPRPVSRDFALLYRDRYETGELSPYFEVMREGTPWKIRKALWHPESRSRKALSDAATYLLRLAQESGNRDALVLSVPYLLLLNRVSAITKPLGARERQFILVRYSLLDDPVLCFASAFHVLDYEHD
jgi:hypothetical protein